MTDSKSDTRINGEKTRPSPPVEHQFKPGNPGRKKGSRNKLGEDFITALAEDFEANGVAVIQAVRDKKPEVYLKVVADLLPKDLNLNVNHFDTMTDEQMLRRFVQISELAKPLLARMPLLTDDTGTATSRH